MVKKLFLFAVLMIVSNRFVIFSAEAADPCQCYCGSKAGAVAIGAKDASVDSCLALCDKNNQHYISCAVDPSQTPIQNGMCWNEQDCLSSKNEDGTSIWGDEQPEECEAGDHYCYPPEITTPLNVTIGQTTHTVDIGSYINVIFTYGMGAAGVFAVVMIMIGGVQYIIGSGTGGEDLSKGKERIKNAVIGLVLLLAAYTVLATVNPALVHFKSIRSPKPKPSLFLTAYCETYGDTTGSTGKKYTVEPTSTDQGENKNAPDCGDKGNVTKDKNGVPVSDTECTYGSCSADKLCAQTESGDYKCMTCDDAGKLEILNAGFEASSAHCASLTPVPSGTSKDQCVRGTLTTFGGAAVPGWSGGQAYCARVEVDCASISECSDYESATVYIGGSANLSFSQQNFTSWPIDVAGLKSVCEGNPCSDEPTMNEKVCSLAVSSSGAVTCGSAVSLP